jgi:hypothetical protein
MIVHAPHRSFVIRTGPKPQTFSGGYEKCVISTQFCAFDVIQAEGCSGGKFELDEEDDQQFEVDDAVCADGKKYDLKFDMQIAVEAEKSGLRGVPSPVCRHHTAV